LPATVDNDLGVLPGDTLSVALAASGDGSVIVGKSGAGDPATTGHEYAFIWNETSHMRDLRAVLASAGVNLTGWTLTEATGVSSNGRVIVGKGVNPQGLQEGWIANLGTPCSANCDGSTAAPLLTANDFQCFLNKFAAAPSDRCLHMNSYVNFDGSTSAPVLNANDFQAFLNSYATGCP